MTDNTGNAIRLCTRETVRTGRYALVGAEPAHARRLWFALHGYGQLASRFVRPFTDAVPADTCVVAPEGLSRFYREMPRPDGGHLTQVGATWMTREGREEEMADAERWLSAVHDDLLPVAPQGAAVGVLAFSQGVATAIRWIASGGVRPQALVVWAGGLPDDVEDASMTQALERCDVVLVNGTQDPFVQADAHAAALARLRRWQPQARAVSFEGDHRLHRDTLAALLRDFSHEAHRS
jgi:predicted esterase